MHSHQLIERSLANLAVWRLDPIPSLCSGFSLIAQRNTTWHLLHRAPKFRRIMVSSITATNLTLNHLLDNIASLEHQNQNVRCIVDIEGSLDDASSIRWFIRWPSGAGAELTLLQWASESQTSVSALLIGCLKPDLVAFEPLKSLIGTPLGPWPRAWWRWRFSRDTFIRWLIRVIELGLQLTPLLNRGSQSSHQALITELTLLWLKAKAFELS